MLRQEGRDEAVDAQIFLHRVTVVAVVVRYIYPSITISALFLISWKHRFSASALIKMEKRSPSAAFSILAGGLAGAAETCVTVSNTLLCHYSQC